jgi:hypothetical protein
MAGDHSQNCGFTATAWSKQTAVCASRQSQVDVADSNCFTKALGDVDKLNRAMLSHQARSAAPGSIIEPDPASLERLRWIRAIEPSAKVMTKNETAVVTVPRA